MAPHDKSYEGLPLIITDHAFGVHSIRQEGEEFEVRLLPSPQHTTESSKGKPCRLLLETIKSKKHKKNKKRSSSVRFEKQPDIREIPHKSEIGPEEKALLWSNYHDWNSMQNERQRITRAITFGNLTVETQTEDLYLRGLENLIPTLAAKRRENIHLALRLVKREQYQAKLERRSIDVDRLARSYGSLTQDSKDAAYAQGLEDFYQVLKDDGIRILAAIV